MSSTLPDYASLEKQLAVAGAAIAPAELHGVVCGLLCMAGRVGTAEWLGEQLATFSGSASDVEAAFTMLEDLEHASWAALSGTQMQFVPVLPDDDVDLAGRASALGQWCLGFIGGLALGGWNELDPGAGSIEIREIVSDFSAISNAGLGDAELSDAESAETSYVELHEYVRVGVQFVFESLVSAPADSPPPAIH